MTTTNVEDNIGSFDVMLRYQNCENKFYNKQLPINENAKFDNMLSDVNFKKSIKNA